MPLTAQTHELPSSGTGPARYVGDGGRCSTSLSRNGPRCPVKIRQHRPFDLKALWMFADGAGPGHGPLSHLVGQSGLTYCSASSTAVGEEIEYVQEKETCLFVTRTARSANSISPGRNSLHHACCSSHSNTLSLNEVNVRRKFLSTVDSLLLYLPARLPNKPDSPQF